MPDTSDETTPATLFDSPESVLLDPEEVREQSLIKVDIGRGQFVLAKTVDMPSMVLEGLVPMPLLNAVMKLLDMKGNEDPATLLSELGEAAALDMLNLMRRHAVATVIQPTITHDDDQVKGHLPVTLLTLTQLTAIWSATCMVPVVAPAAAARFRRVPRPNAPDVPPARENVRPGPQPVVEPSRSQTDVAEVTFA